MCQHGCCKTDRCKNNPSIPEYTSQLSYDGGAFSCSGNAALDVANCKNFNEVIQVILANLCQPNALYSTEKFQQFLAGQPLALVTGTLYTVTQGMEGIYRFVMNTNVTMTDDGTFRTRALKNSLDYDVDTDRQIQKQAGSGLTTSCLTMYISEIQLNVGDTFEVHADSTGTDPISIAETVIHLQKIKPLP